jgi:hypothetical protein
MRLRPESGCLSRSAVAPTGVNFSVFEMKRGCLEDVGAELLPGVSFSKDGVAKRTRAIAAFLSVADFENQFRVASIAELTSRNE